MRRIGKEEGIIPLKLRRVDRDGFIIPDLYKGKPPPPSILPGGLSSGFPRGSREDPAPGEIRKGGGMGRKVHHRVNNWRGRRFGLFEFGEILSPGLLPGNSKKVPLPGKFIFSELIFHGRVSFLPGHGELEANYILHPRVTTSSPGNHLPGYGQLTGANCIFHPRVSEKIVSLGQAIPLYFTAEIFFIHHNVPGEGNYLIHQFRALPLMVLILVAIFVVDF